MKIVFLLPGHRMDVPIGGHKIVYQYANYLCEQGFEVEIANNIFAPSNEKWYIEVLRVIHAFIRYVIGVARKRNTCKGWFNLSECVVEKNVWSYRWRYATKADYYVATDATTSPFLIDYHVQDTHKIYFIQGYENWRMTETQLRETYRYPFVKVVISKWLQKVLTEARAESIVIPNGFNSCEFHLDIPIEKKDKYLVSMLYHEGAFKNVQMGFKALAIVKEKYPTLRVLLYGVYEKPQNLPAWYEYYCRPTIEQHNALNNQSAIYVATSSQEGWGLTVGEAMMCGQAVACTDAGGYLEMATDGVNALVSPVDDSESLALNVIRLIEDDELRMKLARNGYQSIQKFSIERSLEKFGQLFV